MLFADNDEGDRVDAVGGVGLTVWIEHYLDVTVIPGDKGYKALPKTSFHDPTDTSIDCLASLDARLQVR
jgi:hypothetical protein